MRRGWRDAAPWVPFLSLVAAYSLGSLLIGPVVGWRGLMLSKTVALIAAIFGAVLVFVATFVLWIVYAVRATREGSGVAALWHGARMARGEVARITLRVTVLVGCTALVFSVLISWRVAIPTIQPFAWDATFDRWDVALHGIRPWHLTHALLGHPLAKGWLPPLVDLAYSQGGSSPILALLWCSVQVRSVRAGSACSSPTCSSSRSWLVPRGCSSRARGRSTTGGSSARVDPYAPLLPPSPRGSGRTSCSARSAIQEYLWSEYVAGRSAAQGDHRFPSMHVSAAVLLALAVWSWRRWRAGVLGWLFAALTLFGSVALGWHYAVDGYAAVVGLLTLWWLAGSVKLAASLGLAGCSRPRMTTGERERPSLLHQRWQRALIVEAMTSAFCRDSCPMAGSSPLDRAGRPATRRSGRQLARYTRCRRLPRNTSPQQTANGRTRRARRCRARRGARGGRPRCGRTRRCIASRPTCGRSSSD